MCEEGDGHWLDYYEKLHLKTLSLETMTEKEKKDYKLLTVARDNERIILYNAELERLKRKKESS